MLKEDMMDNYDNEDLVKKIDNHIDDFCLFLSANGSWSQDRFDRTQRQLIANILYDMSIGKNVILEAPTGTGKSIIALFVATYFNSYILTSDKMLQDQYDKFIKIMLANNVSTNAKPAYRNAVVLKGQDNYNCSLTGLPFTTCQFQEQGLTHKKIYDSMPCGKKCPYLATKRKAADSQVAVFNYSYWLMQMHVNVRGTDFGPRTATIFDECHKIDDILQNFIDINIGPRFIQDCSKAESLIAGMSTVEEQGMYVQAKEVLFGFLKQLIAQTSAGDAIDNVRATILNLSKSADGLLGLLQKIDDLLTEKLDATKQLSPFENAFRRFVSKLNEICFGLETMLDATEDSPSDLIVILKQETSSVSFKCINDALLAKRLVHPVTKVQLWMSATIGDLDTFANLNAIENYSAYSISSTFNFEHSPINICKPLISMSYKNKTENMSKLLAKIDDIIDNWDCHNGIIHTSTKEIARYIVSNSRHNRRMLTYTDAEDKKAQLAKLTDKTNYIVVGFSITEGVDLPDDKCRFTIIAKLAWQNLGDMVVSKKAENHPEWYVLKTLQQLIQGIGRGIRHENDWCVSYILDSSYTRLASKLKMSSAIAERIKVIEDKPSEVDLLANDDFFNSFK